jgi:hypothetical protein
MLITPNIWFFESGFYYAAQTGLELSILLPQVPNYWDYRLVLLCPAPKSLIFNPHLSPDSFITILNFIGNFLILIYDKAQ